MSELKIRYRTAIKLLKEEINEFKKSLIKDKFQEKYVNWVDEKPIISKNNTFLKDGVGQTKFEVKSSCPYYNGYYINSHLGAIDCSLVDNPLPSVVYDIRCSKENCEECPIAKHKDLALRQAEENLVNSVL